MSEILIYIAVPSGWIFHVFTQLNNIFLILAEGLTSPLRGSHTSMLSSKSEFGRKLWSLTTNNLKGGKQEDLENKELLEQILEFSIANYRHEPAVWEALQPDVGFSLITWCF